MNGCDADWSGTNSGKLSPYGFKNASKTKESVSVKEGLNILCHDLYIRPILDGIIIYRGENAVVRFGPNY